MGSAGARLSEARQDQRPDVELISIRGLFCAGRRPPGRRDQCGDIRWCSSVPVR